MDISSALATIDDCQRSPAERLAAARILAANFTPDLDAVCEIDLHTHSFYSDGYQSPSTRVFEAFRRRMVGLAVCDHDVFDGQLEALEAGRIFGVEVVPGIEFYTDRPGVEIIGHFPDIPRFMAMLASGVADAVVEPIRQAKKLQLRGMMERVPQAMRQFGMTCEITSEDEVQYVRNGVSTKGDISVIMWQKYGPELAARGVAADVKVFQSKYTTKDAYLNLPLELELDISPAAFVKRILDWGGLPGLPHPVELRNKEGLGNDALRQVIEDLGAAGLRTIEVDGFRNGVCPETGLNQTDLLERMRQAYNAAHPERSPLLFTNGSDDHHQPNEGLELGCGKNRNLRPEFGRRDNLSTLAAAARR